MKNIQTLLGLAVCGVLLNAGFTASADNIKVGYATVVRVQGSAMQGGVSYSLVADGPRYPLVAGKLLAPGATIYTGEDGVVDVVLGKAIGMPQATWVPQRISLAVDSPVRGLTAYSPSAEQNVVRVMPNTALSIDKLTTTSAYADTVSDTELNLQKGSIYASVKKLNAAAQYLVKTPTGIAGVRGTQFSIALNDDGTIKNIAVFRVQDPSGGLVLAPNGASTPFSIVGGQMWEPGDANPVPLPPGLTSTLHFTFDSLRTFYYQWVSYDRDITQFLESSDFGSF